eukprot:gene850-1059_t
MITLSKILIFEVLKFIESEVERLNFYLVCKATWQMRGQISGSSLIYIDHKDDLIEIKRFHQTRPNSFFKPPISLKITPSIVEELSSSEFNANIVKIAIHVNDFPNQSIETLISMVPSTTKKLLLGISNSTKLRPGVIPQSIESIQFIGRNGFALEQDAISNSVSTLTIDYQSFLLSFKALPSGITRMTLSYSEPLANYTPQTGMFPAALTYLDLGGSGFNHSISEGFLPPNLETLKLGFSFNQPLLDDKVFPRSLTKLVIINHIYPSKNIKIPTSVINLVCPWTLSNGTILGSNIKTLKLMGEILTLEKGTLPESITRLTFRNRHLFKLEPGILPPKLKYLKFYSQIHLSASNLDKLSVLPEGLETLYISLSPNSIGLDITKLPSSLKVLHLGKNFNQPLKQGDLPPNLETLYIGSIFDQPQVIHGIPNSLKCLSILYPAASNENSLNLIKKLLVGKCSPIEIKIGDLFTINNIDIDTVYIRHFGSIYSFGFISKIDLFKKFPTLMDLDDKFMKILNK